MINGYLSGNNMTNMPFVGGPQPGIPNQNNNWGYGNSMIMNQPQQSVSMGNSSFPQMTQNNQGSMQPRILTRIVNREEDIAPGDVPTDGTYCIFIRSDLKEIYVKTWGFNGYEGNTYSLVVDPSLPAQNEPSPFDEIIERLNRIEGYMMPVCSLPDPQHGKKPAANPKKEVKADAQS